MPEPAPTCPSTIELERLAEGAPATPEQSAHLLACESCRERVDASRRDATFLTRVRHLVAPALAPDGSPRIAGYRVQEVISRGAQGVVYKGVQESTHRPVAIKLLQSLETTSSRQRARAEREAEIAARLRHPNIVTVFESRKLGDGRVAVIMEFVDGVALDAWKPEGLAAAERLRPWLETFTKVCDAVHHAHLNGVIHRDLKPANILVTPEARPVVLDFGIAKAEGLHTTRTGEFAGTPAYASPEQVAGHPGGVDALTDVYSLGVILYHAACGSMPYELDGSMFAMAQTIANTPPKPPRQANPAIAHDLEAIILRALRKEKEYRYQAAAALARDIERFLAGQPVEARAGSGWYMLRKAVAMNRRQLGWLGAGLGVLACSAGAVAWSVGRAAEASRRAAFDREQMVAENVRARAVTELLREALPNADPAHPEVAAVIGSGLSHLYFRLESGGFADDPALDQAVRRLWGSIYTGLGSGKAAQLVEYSEVSLRNGLVRLRLQHPSGEHPDIAAATHELAGVLLVRERYDEAVGVARDALKMRDRLLGPAHVATAESRALLARCLLRLGRGQEAVHEADLALAALREQPEQPSDLAIASLLDLKARVERDAGALDRAEPLLREALRRRLQRLPCDDADLLDTLRESGRLAAALPDSALAGDLAHAWGLTGQSLAQRIADDAGHLASTRMAMQSVEAERSPRGDAIERLMALQERLLGPDDPAVIGSLLALVRVSTAEGQHERWAVNAERAATALAKRFGRSDLSVLLCLEQAAAAWSIAGEDDRAVELSERACRIWEETPPGARDALFAANTRRRYATYLAVAGHAEQAAAEARLVMEALTPIVGPRSYLLASAEAILALALVDQGQRDDADRHSAHAMHIFDATPKAPPDQRNVVCFIRGHVLHTLARHAEARPLLQASWDGMWSRAARHSWNAQTVRDMMLIHQALGQADEAGRWQTLAEPLRATPGS